ncbi:MAG: hypothetical protein E7048_11440 [Lentisphaerae bacterium]|nr:hypothetical protein [Lentisphaerota bacterium]
MNSLLSKPDFIVYGPEEIEIPELLIPVFHGSVEKSFQTGLTGIIDRFCTEELKALAGKNYSGLRMKCDLYLEPGFIPDKVQKNKIFAEAFELQMTREGIKITASAQEGLRQGVNTLLELFRTRMCRGKIRVFTMQDAPRLPIRGVHLFLPARADLPFYRRFVSRFLPALHCNTVFLEVGGGMRFDRHPEINEGTQAFARWVFDHHSRPMGPGGRFQDSAHVELAGGDCLEKDEVRALVEWTRSCGVEVIPEIPSLTHSYYLTAAHREIAELPDALWPDAYCASNPRSREILFDVMEEYIETISPRMIHIGHDEWRAPALCPKCQNKAPELFAQDVCAIHEFLSKKNIAAAMWADGLLPICDGAATYTCIDSIPRDILLLHWEWQFARHQERLSSRNFKMILGNFNMQMQQNEWEETIADPNILGAEISSWIGMNRDRFAVEGTLWQMLCSANFLWQGTRLSQDDMNSLASNYLPHINSRFADTPLASCVRDTNSVPVEISSHLNTGSLVSNSAMEWAVDSLLPGQRSWRNVTVDVPDPWNNKYMKCVLTAASGSQLEENSSRSTFLETLEKCTADIPESVTVKVGKKVEGLLFFHFSSNSGIRKNAPYQTVDEEDPLEWCCHIGFYEINYASGTVEKIPLRCGFNIDDFKTFYGDRSKFPLPDSVPAIRVDAFSGTPAGAVGALEWRNPRPDDEITSVTVRAIANTSQVFPVLFALTALE